MEIKFRKKTISIEAKKVSEIGKFSGLMFKSKESENLLFEFKHESLAKIHSFFVFFDFLAIWLDEKNQVVDFQIVKPFAFSVSPKFPSRKLVEIPLNVKNTKIIELFVGKRKI